MSDFPSASLEELQSRFSRMTYYPRENTAEVCIKNGPRIRESLESRNFESALREVTYDFSCSAITMVTEQGERLDIDPRVDLGSPRVLPVVYLDQAHWSTLSRRLYRSAKINEADARAADKLIELAEARQVILPVSSGHALETSALYNAKRQNLATTILKLSRGWQMRHPIRVRKHEMANVLLKGTGPIGIDEKEVFSTAPGTMDTKKPVAPAGESSQTIAYLHFALTAYSSVYDALLDPERIEPVKLTTWCDHHNRIANDEVYLSRKRSEKRSDALAITLIDVTSEALEVALRAGITDPKFIATQLHENLQHMPFLSLYADVVDFRLSNRAKWVPNDLIDMLYLGCAAAYADVVISERVAANYLRRAWRNKPGSSPAVATLSEGVELLEGLL